MCALHEEQHAQITYESLLAGNKEWVAKTLEENPDFFNKLAKGQKPPVLWIGCSDSRVPANQITNTNPGDIFVLRNIANVVVHTDMSMLSVLDYAVNVLGVEHVIVCGHYGCGGVEAALGNKQFGIIDNWLRAIKDTYRLHHDEMERITDHKERCNRLVELNVAESVYNLSKTSIVQNKWANGAKLSVHGWVYSIETGLITDLGLSSAGPDNLSPVFRVSEASKVAE
ncbi:carbonic anhydrase [Pedobacter sp. SAFR-022]|uniref:carbonic anhydrase n=1 Tax=Pedobacter sp. SAFR-022 TaxID=3436861 RepID=UPI003F8037F0